MLHVNCFYGISDLICSATCYTCNHGSLCIKRWTRDQWNNRITLKMKKNDTFTLYLFTYCTCLDLKYTLIMKTTPQHDFKSIFPPNILFYSLLTMKIKDICCASKGHREVTCWQHLPMNEKMSDIFVFWV